MNAGGVSPVVSRVIVVLERNDRGVQAFEWSRQFATVLGAPLIAWVGVDNHSAEHSIDDEHMFETDTAGATRSWLEQRRGEVDEIRVVESVDEDLVSSGEHGDVVVLGVDATDGITGWALGSRSHGLAHRLLCPLIVVPPGLAPPVDAPIVVGVDGNDPNSFVVEWAKQLAADLHRTLLPVFAYNPIYDSFDNEGDYGAGEHAARHEAASEEVALTESAGSAPEVLVDVATASTAYLTVVGAKREHALGGLLLGKVVDHLLHRPPSPVAVITYATPGDASEASAER
jgi:nucleotide-binding universal stress UspA family protein